MPAVPIPYLGHLPFTRKGKVGCEALSSPSEHMTPRRKDWKHCEKVQRIFSPFCLRQLQGIWGVEVGVEGE